LAQLDGEMLLDSRLTRRWQTAVRVGVAQPASGLAAVEQNFPQLCFSTGKILPARFAAAYNRLILRALACGSQRAI
jgi:hypothetical protein